MNVAAIATANKAAVSEFTTMEGVEVYASFDLDAGESALHVVIPIRERESC